MNEYGQVIVLKIEPDCILAMRPGGEVIRIQRKEGVQVGDSIYVLPEDIQNADGNNLVAFEAAASAPMNKKKQHKWVQYIAGFAAAVAICLSMLFVPEFTMGVYAVASFDAEQSLQLELDDRHRVIRAISMDGSISEEELRALKGKNIEELRNHLDELVGEGTWLVSCALQNGGTDPELEQDLQHMSSKQDLVYLSGTSQDIQAAEQKELSLGHYVAGVQAADWGLEDLDNQETHQIKEVLEQMEKNPDWMDVEEFREALEEKKEILTEAMGHTWDDDEDDDQNDEKPEVDSDESPKQDENDDSGHADNESVTTEEVEDQEEAPEAPEEPEKPDQENDSDEEDDD